MLHSSREKSKRKKWLDRLDSANARGVAGLKKKGKLRGRRKKKETCQNARKERRKKGRNAGFTGQMLTAIGSTF